MATVTLKQGETLAVALEDTDGCFIIQYGPDKLTVDADMPDQQGRVGIIYEESFGVYPDPAVQKVGD